MSMWQRQRHTRGPRNFREEAGGRVLDKIGLLYWIFVFGWVLLRSVAYGLMRAKTKLAESEPASVELREFPVRNCVRKVRAGCLNCRKPGPS